MNGSPRSRTVGLAVVAAAATCWGTWPLFVRHGGQSGLVVGFLTMAVMALPSLVLARAFHLRDRGALVALVVIGVSDAANVALYFSALEAGPVVVAVLTHYLAPLLVALTAPLLLKEPRSRRALAALPLMLLGLFLVLPSGASGSAWQAGLFGGGSAVFYAALVLASRRAAVSFPPLAVTSFHAVVSALLLLVVFRERVVPTRFDAGLGLLLAGATVNGLLGAFLFNFGLPRIGAQLTGVLTYLEPLVAAVIGILLLGEPATGSTVLGLGLVLGAGTWTALER
ncbi:MAG: EamA family transporter [Myxococcaceae bacterium]|nr:EamA family transporter [Myxococcaceae bacterium]